jgi:hypothetical protein
MGISFSPLRWLCTREVRVASLLLLIAFLMSFGVARAASPFIDRGLELGIVTDHTQRGATLRGLPDVFGPGACVLDANGDQWLDLLVLSGKGVTRHYGERGWWSVPEHNRVYLNRGGDGFVVVPLHPANGREAANAQGCSIADLDDDGYDDIIVTTTGRDQIWQNNGNGTFEPVEGSPLGSGARWTTGVTTADVNADGQVDVMIGGFIDYQQNERVYEDHAGYMKRRSARFLPRKYESEPTVLYLNQGNLEFEPASAWLGERSRAGRTIDLRSADINNDGWPDIIERNARHDRTRVWLNDKGSGFRQAPVRYPAMSRSRSGATKFTDLNRDGALDAVLAAKGGVPLIYAADMENEKTLSNAERAKVTSPYNTQDIAIGDFDNDGNRETYMANGYQRPNPDGRAVPLGQWDAMLQRRDGHWEVERVQPASVKSARSVVRFDFDNDGDLDLYVANNNAFGTLLVNRTNRNARKEEGWVSFDLVGGTGGSRGSRRVELTTSEGERVAFAGNREARLGQASDRVHFGLEPGEQLRSLVVEWSDGSTERYEQLKRGAIYRIERGSGTVVALGEVTSHGGSIPRELRSKEARQAKAWAMARARRGVRGEPPNGADEPFQTVREAGWDESVYWLIENLEAGRKICRTSSVLESFYDDRRSAVRTKEIAASYMAEALSRSGDREKVCLLSALGRSESYRGYESIVENVEDVNIAVRRSAVRALGALKQTIALEPLSRMVKQSPVGIAAEAALSMERIESGKGKETVLARLENMETRHRCGLLEALDRINRERLIVDGSVEQWLGRRGSGCNG